MTTAAPIACRRTRMGERALLLTAWQLLSGNAHCFCGRKAVMELRSPPDDDPGPVCAEHGLKWVGVVFAMYRDREAPPG